ncbi:LytR C-terminal domain-containing protein [Spongisporangium articulatum]|uniref:LytR C-terminal domain-containing protein n=1 Tax=Spongisporangium articulatum TaxID=3362603 RepID=A0ABW8AJD5_9ACTN
MAVILLVAGGVYAVLTGGSNPTQSVAGAEDDTTPSASASATPKATQSATTQTTQSAPARTQSAATVDKSVDVVVLNSVSVQGLASRVKASLEADGWNVVKTGNSQERGLATTKVYYPSAALKPTARQIVRDLGFGTIIQNASVSGSGTIKMALGSDAT